MLLILLLAVFMGGKLGTLSFISSNGVLLAGNVFAIGE